MPRKMTNVALLELLLVVKQNTVINTTKTPSLLKAFFNLLEQKVFECPLCGLFFISHELHELTRIQV